MDQSRLFEELRAVVGSNGVVTDGVALDTYDVDASMLSGQRPLVAVLPRDSSQVAQIVRLAAQADSPIVPRGAGTGISGGAIPMRGGTIISTSRMDKIERVDIRNRQATVQTGLVNIELTNHVSALGFQFAPDPSSQRACTIGGNIAENAGGPHCLKYGVTSNHILAVEVVLHDGTILWTGDGITDASGYDLTGLMVGSEGTFGFVTRAIVRLTRLPEDNRVVMALFSDMVSSGEAVSEVVARGHLPTSLEVMDASAIRAVNNAYQLGLPDTARAALIIEVDGVTDGLDKTLTELIEICEAKGAFEVRPARTAEEQARVWAARKSVAGAVGRLAPAYYLVDTVVPRTRLPLMMDHVERLGKEYDLEIVNVFHAGDGNLHPLVLYDSRNPDQTHRAHIVANRVVELSIEQGGAISGEHGVGAEKQEYMPMLFDEADLQSMAAMYAIFNPENRFNPAKMFPKEMNPLAMAKQRRERMTAQMGTQNASVLKNELERILGTEHLLTDDNTAAYTVQGHAPSFVTFPKDVAQLSEVMALCHYVGALVVPWGGGTQQNQGCPVQSPDVVVVTRRMDEVITYEPDDLTISVGAGMTLGELQAILAKHNQMLPIEAPLANDATLGGLVATATDGPRRLGYGTLRDLLLGVTLIEADGAVIRNGGQVVKNVSGYDLLKLFHGSHGTLGVMTSISLKTLPRPSDDATFIASFPERNAAMAALNELAATQLTPTAVEYLQGWDATTQEAQPYTFHQEATYLVVRVEGSVASCERHLRDLKDIVARHHVQETHVFRGDEQDTTWRTIADHTAIKSITDGEAMIRIAVPTGELATAMDYLDEYTTRHGMTYSCNARALNGVIYAHVHGSGEQLRTLQQALVTRWKHSHLLACDPAAKTGMPIWGKLPEGLELMAAIKQAFDPANRLNPGRYIV